MTTSIKRAYDPADPADGTRVLVDRLWPRGLAKDRAALDDWLRDVAPSTELRRWYGHDPARRAEFVRRYHAELEQQPWAAALARLRGYAAAGPVTLITATREVDASHATVLADLLDG